MRRSGSVSVSAVSTVASTEPASTSRTVSWPISSEPTYARLPSGLIATPPGMLVTGMRSTAPRASLANVSAPSSAIVAFSAKLPARLTNTPVRLRIAAAAVSAAKARSRRVSGSVNGGVGAGSLAKLSAIRRFRLRCSAGRTAAERASTTPTSACTLTLNRTGGAGCAAIEGR